MKRFFGLVFSLIVMAGAAAVASAQDMPPQGPPPGGFGGGGGMRMQMPQFADLDKNKDKKISRDEWQGPPQFFDRLDTNKDDAIDETEWTAMRQRFGGGGGPRLGESLGKLLDADKNGNVSRDEFAKLLTLFDLLDANKDGALTQEEMNGFFRAINDAQSQAQNQATGGVDVGNLFANNDKNKDGKLTAEEVANERLFKALDLDKDGTVTHDEAATALKQLAERAKAKKQTQP